MTMIDALLQYQKLDMQIYKLEKEVIESSASKEYASVKKELSNIKDDMTRSDKTSEDLVKKFQDFEDKILKLSKELEEYTNVTDDVSDEQQADYCLSKINGLIGEIDYVKKQIEDCTRSMERTMKNFDVLISRYNEYSAIYIQKKKAFDDFRNTYAPKVIALKKEMAETEKEIMPELILKYRNLRASKTKFPLVAELKNNECQGCFVEAIGAEVKLKETGQIIVECPSCGRLIYKK